MVKPTTPSRRPASHAVGPAAGGVDLWWFPLDPALGCRAVLSSEERRRLAGTGSAAKRLEFLVGRAVMRRVLATYLPLPPGQLEFVYGSHGKPAIDGGPVFNLTHSGGQAVLAVAAHGRLGADIEQVTRSRPYERLARRFFAAAEAEWLAGRGLLADAPAFCHLWTLKEAYVKALGTGLSFSSRRFAIDLDARPPTLAISEAPGDVDRWGFASLDAPPGFAAALCWDQPIGEVRRHDAASLRP